MWSQAHDSALHQNLPLGPDTQQHCVFLQPCQSSLVWMTYRLLTKLCLLWGRCNSKVYTELPNNRENLSHKRIWQRVLMQPNPLIKKPYEDVSTPWGLSIFHSLHNKCRDIQMGIYEQFPPSAVISPHCNFSGLFILISKWQSIIAITVFWRLHEAWERNGCHKGLKERKWYNASSTFENLHLPLQTAW